ncbi:uncharacterized protein LOC110696224 [Chenopodium quinoa]|uniref:uncharacterized protein LOC110696224 n=1 Tax=Chenopodium quinoa TaxID=63459 RepID=UPI000B78085E|nr:uncharacterized protein LOC110696224 [Chenopodium quinoa]
MQDLQGSIVNLWHHYNQRIVIILNIHFTCNDVDVEEGDREGDEANEELNMVNKGDITAESNKDKQSDVVSSSAPVPEFTQINEIDEDEVNKWVSWVSVASYKSGVEFCIGQEFANKDAMIEAVTSYSVQRNQSFKVSESRPTTITFICGRKPVNCSWKLRATRKTLVSDKFTIVTYKGPHTFTCVSDILPKDHSNLKSKFIAHHIRNIVEVDTSVKVRVLIEVMKNLFNYTISYKKAWSAKQIAIAEIFGDWEESYEILPQFMQAMVEANPGTIVHFANRETADPNLHIFQRVFWAFGPSIEGFQHCRPLITIDGTHLYGKYKGTLLIAMSVDANNQLFPLAFAIVECEDGNTWPWFMACIRRFVTQRSGLCVISDRHGGIMKAMKEENTGWREPYAYHRFCIRHLASNVHTQFKNKELKKIFGWTAFQHQKKKFDHGLQKIGEMNVEARRYLANIDASMWSLCHDGGFRYGLKTSNLAEVFSNVLKGARFLPITALVKLTFFRVNTYFVQRRESSKKRFLDGHLYSDKTTKDIEANDAKAVHHKVEMYHRDDDIYQVTTGRGNREQKKSSHTHTVNLSRKTCTCNKLHTYKIPCSHVLACEYMGTFRATFHPIPDKDYWTHYNGPKVVADASHKRSPGRPPSQRLRNEMDEALTLFLSPQFYTCPADLQMHVGFRFLVDFVKDEDLGI